MKIWINPEKAPLAGVPKPMMERRLVEYLEAMKQNGLHVLGGNQEEGSITVNLRHFEQANPGQDKRTALVDALKALGATRIDVEERDVEHLFDDTDAQRMAARAVAKGLQEQDAGICRKLISLTPDEVKHCVYDAFDTLLDHPTPPPELAAIFQSEAEADLVSHGIMEQPEHDPLGPQAEELHDYLGLRTPPKPYVSGYDNDIIE